MNNNELHNETDPDLRPVPVDDLDPVLIDTALQAMRRYAESGRGYGAAFVAYLDVDFELDPDADEEIDFRDRYVGHFADRWSFLRDRLEYLGWSRELAKFTSQNGIWADDLRWNPEVLWEHMGGFYACVERFGGVYAFRR